MHSKIVPEHLLGKCLSILGRQSFEVRQSQYIGVIEEPIDDLIETRNTARASRQNEFQILTAAQFSKELNCVADVRRSVSVVYYHNGRAPGNLFVRILVPDSLFFEKYDPPLVYGSTPVVKEF